MIETKSKEHTRTTQMHGCMHARIQTIMCIHTHSQLTELEESLFPLGGGLDLTAAAKSIEPPGAKLGEFVVLLLTSAVAPLLLPPEPPK